MGQIEIVLYDIEKATHNNGGWLSLSSGLIVVFTSVRLVGVRGMGKEPPFDVCFPVLPQLLDGFHGLGFKENDIYRSKILPGPISP